MAYTPILKSTGVRITIENYELEPGFNEARIARALKGILTDTDTGKRYKIYGKSCSQPHCACDAWAVEITTLTPVKFNYKDCHECVHERHEYGARYCTAHFLLYGDPSN